MKYTYIIPGDPTSSGKIRNNHRRTYDAQKNERAILSINLASQHEDRPLIYGPVHLSIHFYMPPPSGCWPNCKPGSPHYGAPPLTNLILYVEDCARGILMPDGCTIVSMESTKSYDNNPRIEFSIITLQKEGKVWKHQLQSHPQ